LGFGWLDAIHPDDREPMAAHWRRSVEGVAPFDTEVRIRAADGTYRWFKQRAVPLSDANGAVRQWLGTSTDISDVIETREALRAAKEAAEGASMAKSRFLASASHDLRQPMQALFFFSSALEEHIDDDVGKDNLMPLERGLDALKGLLDSLLDISQLDAGVVRPTIEDFPIAILLDHLSASYGPVARGKGLDWYVVPSSLTVRSDRVLLGRILGNLIENAVRYTERGRILVYCRPVGERLLIQVRDTGIGIPEDQMRSIWGEFHQVGNPERDRSQGLGLGLAIVERIGRLLGYRTEVKSRPGEGSSFSVEVPLGEAQAVAEPPPKFTAERGGGRCALVVDDDAIILLGLQTMLSTWDYEVIIAADTEQAIRRLEAAGRVPDIIVADYRLREGRVGTEVVARVREICGKQIPGVTLTGETASECQHEVVSLGLGLAFKPITARQLSLTLEKYLEAAE
jgi:signal transduction histidine kinase